jgi:large subunit ribosomal protein L14e
MSKLPTLPELGRVVEVMNGRHRGMLSVVVGHEVDRFVWIADGDRRKVDAPKKKNVSHIRTTPHVAQEILDELTTHGKVTNARLRYVLAQYREERRETDGALEEGGLPNGER